MRGSYQMIADDNHHFDAEIPEFMLSMPRTLH
jgi:ApaG protein